MNCPVCDKNLKEEDYLQTIVFGPEKTERKLYQCVNCDLQFWHPLKIIPGFYEDETDLACFGENQEFEELSENQKAFLKYFPSKKRGLLLDIGCGNGNFLKEAKKMGFEVFGIDYNEGRIKNAKEKFGIKNAYAINWENFINLAEKENLKFDVITFFDVLEHQDDPKGFILSARKMLKQNGWIAGGVPNRERFLAKQDRKTASTGDFPPHHLIWLNRTFIRNILTTEGFHEIEIYPVPVSLLYCANHLESLIFGKIGKKIKNFVKKILARRSESLEPALITGTETIRENGGVETLNFLRKLRNWIFIPMALIILYYYNKKGRTLYFQSHL